MSASGIAENARSSVRAIRIITAFRKALPQIKLQAGKDRTMNTIGIEHNLDRSRIRKLLTIGLFASVLTGIGDFLLGYGESTAVSSLAASVMASAPNLEDTEHMDKAYHQKWFHAKSMLFPGTVFALIPAVLVGLLVTLIG